MNVTPFEGVAEAFARSVSAAPDRLACVGTDRSVTYRELDEWAETVAAALRTAAPTESEPIGILAENDVAALAAIVGAVKAGRALVMLDPTTPAERIAQTCESATPALTLVGNGLGKLATSIGPHAGILLDIPEAARGIGSPTAGRTSTDQVFTIFFTSGSTGRPKGVVANSTNFAEAVRVWDTMGGQAEAIACTAPLSFAFGLFIAVRALLTASTLYLYDARTRGADALPAWIRDNRITTMGMTPYLSRQVCAIAAADGISFDTLRAVTVGGEPVLPSDVESLRAVTGPECIVYNQFASSEAWLMTRLPIDRTYPLPASGPLPAGFAAPSRDVYLVDDHGERIAEPDVPGTILVAADSVSSGYWRDPELTATKFSMLDDGRTVINTGDLGRWNSRGELVPLGRADNMLKIRGYLVEPAEVEARLRQLDGVADCVVVGKPSPRDAGTTVLVAYLAADTQGAPTVPAIRRALSAQLPSYMVPVQYVVLAELPRNPNGKIDRGALPVPQLPWLGEGELDGPTERRVAEICAGALEIETLGGEDDIFALGADSLAIAEICAALEDEFDVSVDSAGVLKNPTVAQLAAMLKADTAGQLVDGIMITLADGADEAPIFAFAGAVGLAVEFRHLARELRGARPVYAIQSYGLEGGGLPDVTTRQMVRRYVRTMRRVQPSGPYTLVGHSAGAVFACAVAERLLAEGDEVAFVGLLDPLDAGVLERGFLSPDPGSYEGIPRSLRDVRSMKGLREWAYYRRPYLTRSYWRDVRGGSRGRIWGDIASRVARTYRPPSGGLRAGSAVVYVVEGNEGPSIGSAEWFAGDHAEVTVGGDHWTMLRTPFVQKLAEHLLTHLSSAQNVLTR